MKSLLVDALRAANDSDSPTEADPALPSAGDFRLEPDQPPADDAPTIDELELLDPANIPSPANEPDGYRRADDLAAFADVDFLEADAGFTVASGDRRARIEAPVRVAAHATRLTAGFLERAAGTAPYLCLLLALAAAAASTLWHRVADSSAYSDLHSRVPNGKSEQQTGAGITEDGSPSRFPLSVTTAAPNPVDGVETPVAGGTASRALANRAPTIVRRTSRQAMPAGLTDAGVDTFATLAAAFRAYLGGDVGRDYIDWLLNSRAESGGEAAELEIRLLLQQYPDEAPLHRALASSLIAAGRLPEAAASMERAYQLDGHSDKGFRR